MKRVGICVRAGCLALGLVCGVAEANEGYSIVTGGDASPCETFAAEELQTHLRLALGVDVPIETGDIPDEDWKLAYRRHFKTEEIGKRLLIVPEWELDSVRASFEHSEHSNNRTIRFEFHFHLLTFSFVVSFQFASEKSSFNRSTAMSHESV